MASRIICWCTFCVKHFGVSDIGGLRSDGMVVGNNQSIQELKWRCLKMMHFPNQHPLKKEFRRRRIKLWQLRNWTGVSESNLSRYLNRIDPMPGNVERRLEEIVKVLEMKSGGIDPYRDRSNKSPESIYD